MPILRIELYLNGQSKPDLCGRNNTKRIECDGLKLVCEPNDELSKEIKDLLKQPIANFPFEYYSIILKHLQIIHTSVTKNF